MNPGLASVVLTISRPPARGGYDFTEEESGPVAGFTFRARRLANLPGGEVNEAGRMRDFQTARFRIRLAEFRANFQAGDLLTEDQGGGNAITWEVKTWAEVSGTRGLWCEVRCEELREAGEG